MQNSQTRPDARDTYANIPHRDVQSALLVSESSSSSLPVGVPPDWELLHPPLWTSSPPVTHTLSAPHHPPSFRWPAGGGSSLCAVAKGARAGRPGNALVKRPACQSVWGKSGWLAPPSHAHSFTYTLSVCVFQTLGMVASSKHFIFIRAPPCLSDFGKQPPLLNV